MLIESNLQVSCLFYLYILLLDWQLSECSFKLVKGLEPFSQLIHKVLGINVGPYSGFTGLYRGATIAERVILGAKCPVVLLLLKSFFVKVT